MSENKIQVWNYESSEVRTVQVNGEPWFVLADVCKVLELSSPHKVADRLENDERNQIPVTDSLGRYQNTAIINESGLYTVILRSDKPQAKPFRKWVTSEVLPSIRKTGSYSTQSQFADLSPQLQFLIQMEIRQNKLEEEQKKQNQALESMKETVNSTVNYALKIGDSFGRVKEAIVLDRKNWRTETRRILLKIVWKFPTIGTVGSVYNKLYEALESRASVKLDTRLKNLKKRMHDAGASKTNIEKTSKLDVIADDPKLIEIWIGLVKDYCMKVGLDLNIDIRE